MRSPWRGAASRSRELRGGAEERAILLLTERHPPAIDVAVEDVEDARWVVVPRHRRMVPRRQRQRLLSAARNGRGHYEADGRSDDVGIGRIIEKSQQIHVV